MVAILDADKEGLFRSARSLVQMIGRAARNANGKVILYADVMTKSMKEAIDETERRRAIQMKYNEEHGIVPKTIVKEVGELISIGASEDNPKARRKKGAPQPGKGEAKAAKPKDTIESLTAEMKKAASELRFEEAAYLRDKIRQMQG